VKEGDVGIDELLRKDAQTLAHEVNDIDEADLVRLVLASLSASATVDTGAPVPGRPPRAAGPARSGPALTGLTGVTHEISGTGDLPQGTDAAAAMADHLARARSGDPSSTRRVAELLERAGHDAAAVLWWGRAAQLGDPDAIDYVDAFLAGDPALSTSTQFQKGNGKHPTPPAPDPADSVPQPPEPGGYVNGATLRQYASCGLPAESGNNQVANTDREKRE